MRPDLADFDAEVRVPIVSSAGVSRSSGICDLGIIEGRAGRAKS